MAGKTEIKNFDSDIKKLTKNLGQLENSISNLILQTVELNNSLKKGSATQKENAKQTDKLTENTEQLTQQTKEFNKIQKQINSLNAQNTESVKKQQGCTGYAV